MTEQQRYTAFVGRTLAEMHDAGQALEEHTAMIDNRPLRPIYDECNMLIWAPPGMWECMNCGTLRTVEGWTSCEDELGRSCTVAVHTGIGDIAVHDGEPPESNPYRGHGLIGPPREAALRAFRDGGNTAGLTFWHAPGSGGARRLVGPHQVDWRGMR